MKKTIITFSLAVTALLPATAQQKLKSAGYPITPVPFTSVKVWNNTFWGQRLETSRKVTIPLAFSKCESEGRYKNFERAAENMKHPSDKYDVAKLMPYSFDDTDPYKTIEGASYILQTYPDKKLQHYVDSIIDIIGAAQEPDMSSIISDTSLRVLSPTGRQQAVENFLTSPAAMPTASARRWDRTPDRHALFPGIRSQRWLSANFILPQDVSAISTRQSSSLTIEARQQ